MFSRRWVVLHVLNEFFSNKPKKPVETSTKAEPVPLTVSRRSRGVRRGRGLRNTPALRESEREVEAPQTRARKISESLVRGRA